MLERFKAAFTGGVLQASTVNSNGKEEIKELSVTTTEGLVSDSIVCAVAALCGLAF